MVDGLITDAEARRLEQEADAILRQDARSKGFIKKTYGYGKYAKEAGILTPHDIATIRHHEFPAEFDRLVTQDTQEDEDE
jgi:hypothetical protein